jgi:hypothetical protein
MSIPSSDGSPTWIGWHRAGPGEPWRRVCTGSSIDECAKRLSKAVPSPVSNLDLCLTTGAYPRDLSPITLTERKPTCLQNVEGPTN